MKKTNAIRAILLALLPIASQGFAQEVPGSSSKVAFSFTVSTTADALFAKDENGKVISPKVSTDETSFSAEKNGVTTTTTEVGTKIVAAKYTIKEFLTDLTLVEENPLIDDIKGWSVVKVQGTGGELPGLALTPASYFLVKKGEDPISLGGIISTDSTVKLSGIKFKSVVKTTTVAGEGEEEDVTTVESEAYTYSEALKFAGGFALNLDGDAINLSGIYTGSQKLGATKGTKLPVILSGASKLSSLSGTASTGEIVEGSASYGAGAAVDLADYPGFEPEEEEEEGDL
jgi:hypothetical protein